uniref:Uncharacterized protein n=1 Tax=Trichobilharzia regenti TaxID=157069 RepID=A0AA85IT43_TRIRE|nr:unnamed protein product [Trichobilharzia regenti]
MIQEPTRSELFQRMVKNMQVEQEILDALTDHEKAVLFSAIRLEQIKRYKKWDADQEILKKNSENDGKSDNSRHSKRHVNYLCGSDGKLIVTAAVAPDYDRTNYSDCYGSSGIIQQLHQNPSLLLEILNDQVNIQKQVV